MVTGDKGHDVFTQVRALSVEVKPYSCFGGFMEEMVVVGVGVKTGGSRVGGPDLCV